MNETERRSYNTEVRAKDRRLIGTVLRYNDVSPSHRERFEPGSLALADSVHLDLHHDAMRALAWTPGGGLELRDEDGAMQMVAEVAPIPAGDVALAEVRSGTTTGLSVEFRAIKERREAGIRIISQALLTGIGLVRRPSYEASRVEARDAGRKLWL